MRYTSELCGNCDGTGYVDGIDPIDSEQIVDEVCPSCDGGGLVEMGSHK